MTTHGTTEALERAERELADCMAADRGALATQLARLRAARDGPRDAHADGRARVARRDGAAADVTAMPR